MKTGLLGMALLACALSAPTQAQTAAVVEVAAARAGVFHHLDAAGRRGLAVAGDKVALVWEDNRTGSPRCYLGIKTLADAAFRETPLGTGECFEPGVATLAPGRFLLIWEDETGVNAAIAAADGPGAATRLAPAGGQGAVVDHPELGAFAAWSAPEGRWRRIWRAPLAIDGNRLRPGPAEPADALPPGDDQLFPTLAVAGKPPGKSLLLAWEDRRFGHTVIFSSRSDTGTAWSAPLRVSSNPTGRAQGDLGRGTGAMRPVLAAFGDRVAAAWLDKRDFLSGYDVYAALSEDGGASFGQDRKAQDSFGDAIPQWHVTAAGNPRGELVIAWDDERDGTADIWLTRLVGSDYGGDTTLPAISGPAHQSDPVVALDDAGNLHLAWIERGPDGATRLLYFMQKP